MIISQHEGQIWAQNTPEGTVFSFVLPFHRPSAIIPDTRHLGEDALLATK
jgi:signal transduction histidine kinase